MKKFWIRLAIYLAAMVGLAWVNNAVMLHFHDLAYYYTPSGMLLNAVVTLAEALIVWPISELVISKWVLSALKEGLKEEKESIITEFKEN